MATRDRSSVSAHWLPNCDMPLIEGAIGDVLRNNAACRPDRPAIIWPEGSGVARMTYAELLVRAERCARWLLDQAKPGDRIAIWSLNSLDYAVLIYGSALAGTIISPFNSAWTDAEAGHAHDLVAPALFFIGKDGQGGDLFGRARGFVRCPIHDLSVVADAQPSDPDRTLPAIAASDPYLIQFTSGTTGRAKGALLSHRAGLLGGWLALRTDNACEDDVWLTPVPFHHISGSCSITLGALSFGGAFVLLERFNTDLVVSLIEPAGVTRMGGVPTMWYDLLRHPDLPADLKLRNVSLGGANVAASLVREIEGRTGGSVSIVYAQSEFPIMTATLPADDAETKTQTVGRPVPHVEFKIVDAGSGNTLGHGEIGDICVRGPLAMDGYWGNAEASAKAFDPEGFLRTGDLGSMDAGGICRIHGRASETIIRGGENIYPAEVENALLQHPSVVRAAVIGIADARLGQKVVAVVQLAPDAQADEPGLKSHAASLVSHFKVPAEWRFVETMPMTASGKVRKIDLAGLFQDA